MKGLAATRIVALAIAAGVVALACRAHLETGASASGVDVRPPQPAPQPAVADSDGDGIPDSRDACVLGPEGFDGFEDKDGCPDPDNDRDGIPDAIDKCPNEPETYNGFQDADGCPDRTPVMCCFGRRPPFPKELIAFDDNSAVIRPSTAAVLDGIVAYLQKEYPEALSEALSKGRSLVTLEGHAEAYEHNPPALAAARVAAVKRYLDKRGIPSRPFQRPWFRGFPDIVGDELDGAPDRRRVDIHFMD